MTDAIVNILIAILIATRANSRAALKKVDPNMVVYTKSGWRVRDLIGHMTDWDIEAVRGLQAFVRGETYEIPNFTGFDDYNHARVKVRWQQPSVALIAEWEAIRETLKESVRAIPPESMSQTIRYPWPEAGSVAWMIRIMAGHELQHVEDIVNASSQT